MKGDKGGRGKKTGSTLPHIDPEAKAFRDEERLLFYLRQTEERWRIEELKLYIDEIGKRVSLPRDEVYPDTWELTPRNLQRSRQLSIVSVFNLLWPAIAQARNSIKAGNLGDANADIWVVRQLERDLFPMLMKELALGLKTAASLLERSAQGAGKKRQKGQQAGKDIVSIAIEVRRKFPKLKYAEVCNEVVRRLKALSKPHSVRTVRDHYSKVKFMEKPSG